jgi:sigma-B regulation protein RsbU (phosphoserine phosphatase)
MSLPARILVVDDTPHNVTLLEDLLTARGYAVQTASDGIEALARIGESAPDLVLLDIMMPRMNGYEVLERLRADPVLRHIPVVVISAVDELESVVRCLELGAEDYLPKPFNSTLLRARVSASLDKKRMRDEIVSYAQRIERDLEFARAIQMSMVPSDLPAADTDQSLAVHAALQPAREIGGDLYDYFWIAPRRLCLLVADVSDKGASAALFMARTRTTIRLLAARDKAEGAVIRARELVELINTELCQDNPHAMFVTLFIGMVDGGSGHLEWCSAGHPPPYRIAADGGVSVLPPGVTMPLGLETPASCSAGTVHLAPGESLFVYTDGVTEAANPEGDMFGDARLAAALGACAGVAPRELVDRVLGTVRTFTASAAPSDDIAALACRWTP